MGFLSWPLCAVSLNHSQASPARWDWVSITSPAHSSQDNQCKMSQNGLFSMPDSKLLLLSSASNFFSQSYSRLALSVNISTVFPVILSLFPLESLEKASAGAIYPEISRALTNFFQVRFFSHLARRPLGHEGNLRGELRSLSLPLDLPSWEGKWSSGNKSKSAGHCWQDRMPSSCHHHLPLQWICSMARSLQSGLHWLSLLGLTQSRLFPAYFE